MGVRTPGLDIAINAKRQVADAAARRGKGRLGRHPRARAAVHLLACKRRLETPFLAFPLDRHSQDVGSPLQKGQVMRDELVLGPTVDLQHPKRLAVALQDDVHGAADAVLHEKLGGSKTLLVLKVISRD
jgi:hypothetical protein